MKLRLVAVFFTLIAMLYGCFDNQDEKKSDRKRMTKKEMSEAKVQFAKINKVLIDEDRSLIEGYIKRYRLDGMKENGAGLYYLVWGEPMGDSIRLGNLVEYKYKLSLLDGTICYQNDSSNPKSFKVGSGGVESGLEQAVLLMRQGQKGKFILPPHLAYGLIGDSNKIPARAIIVYDIEILNVYR